MEAQFAWDDKTIRQTFIRKVRLPRRRGTPVPLAALFWQHVPPPTGLRHPPDAAAGHGRHRGALLLLVTPLLEELVYSFTLVETVIWILLPLQRACEVLHPDPPWPVHGVLVSEITAEMQRHHVFFSPLWRLISCSDCSLMFFATYIALSCCGELRWTCLPSWVTQLCLFGWYLLCWYKLLSSFFHPNRRQFPWNIILLVLFVSTRPSYVKVKPWQASIGVTCVFAVCVQTLSMAFMMGFVSR